MPPTYHVTRVLLGDIAGWEAQGRKRRPSLDGVRSGEAFLVGVTS